MLMTLSCTSMKPALTKQAVRPQAQLKGTSLNFRLQTNIKLKLKVPRKAEPAATPALQTGSVTDINKYALNRLKDDFKFVKDCQG